MGRKRWRAPRAGRHGALADATTKLPGTDVHGPMKKRQIAGPCAWGLQSIATRQPGDTTARRHDSPATRQPGDTTARRHDSPATRQAGDSTGQKHNRTATPQTGYTLTQRHHKPATAYDRNKRTSGKGTRETAGN